MVLLLVSDKIKHFCEDASPYISFDLYKMVALADEIFFFSFVFNDFRLIRLYLYTFLHEGAIAETKF